MPLKTRRSFARGAPRRFVGGSGLSHGPTADLNGSNETLHVAIRRQGRCLVLGKGISPLDPRAAIATLPPPLVRDFVRYLLT
jgi:hypothetical protein